MDITPVILSGGSGSRLWPLSRAMRPKQFLGVTDEQTLFQLTLDRLRGLPGLQAPLIVSNQEHRFLVAEQCRETGLSPGAILLEPFGRNTAPAIAVAALHSRNSGNDPVLLVLPSDHIFTKPEAFRDSALLAAQAAQQGKLVTFGIVPTQPETGYGYLRAGETTSMQGVSAVAQFVEKPDLATAERYIASGDYFWNSGMFMFRASVYLDELKKHHPEMLRQCELACDKARIDLDFIRLDEAAMTDCPSDSVDYAIMEKTDKATMVALDAGWNDVGAWSSVWQVLPKDARGNALRGDVIAEAATDCYVHADHRLVTLLGVKDLVVIETADAILVADKTAAQDVKKIVNRLNEVKRSETHLHREVFRPWGSYDSLGDGPRYQVKSIRVKPGAKLSLQYHHHRAEHWVVVSGTAKVLIGEKSQLVRENESVFIPQGEQHMLENPGKTWLELIEVQSGSYLGEDDIVRLEDVYGRAGSGQS
jgi:mannose-1-phosphate guanylyltransferase/mannose-6-phosphate isomerase